MATQLRAKPSEMLLAISTPVGVFSKVFMLPSGNVMFIIGRYPNPVSGSTGKIRKMNHESAQGRKRKKQPI
jgi:hypothetical protein